LPEGFNLGKLFGSSGTIRRLSFGGVSGRLTAVIIAAVAGIAFVSRNTTPTGALIAILAIVFVVVIMAVVVLFVVNKNPELATLEGIHVIHYKQMVVGAKDFVPPREFPPVPDPGLPKLPPTNEERRAGIAWVSHRRSNRPEMLSIS
jgi:hypothetical protein